MHLKSLYMHVAYSEEESKVLFWISWDCESSKQVVKKMHIILYLIGEVLVFLQCEINP